MAVGSYRRLEEIGRGSFATVYKASMSVSTCPACPHITITLSLVQLAVLRHHMYAITNEGRKHVAGQIKAESPQS